MLNKSFLFCLAALVAAPVALGAAPEPFTKTLLGVKHTCVDESACWSENNGFLIAGNEGSLVYLVAKMGKAPNVKTVKKGVYQAWVKYVTIPPMNGTGSALALMQADSKEQKLRALQIVLYDEDGKVFHSTNTPEEWHYVIPNSVEETINVAISAFGQLTNDVGEEKLKSLNAFNPPRK